MIKRVLVVAVVALLLAVAAAYALRPARGVPEGAPREAEMADAIGTDVMRHIHRGNVPGRSGDLFFVPQPHSFMLGAWDMETLGTNQPDVTTSHPNPWGYLARVPILIYGPSYAPSGVQVTRPVDISSVAPTYAALAGEPPQWDPQGAPFHEVTRFARSGGAPPPKAIVTVVVDGGGWNALQYHPYSWPGIASLIREGTVYTNATIGSAPSITGALHPTFGTGSFPRVAGIPGNQLRAPEGGFADAWQDNADPRYLRVPTLSDLYDEAHDNKPVMASVAYEGWHLGMLGHGAAHPNGDKDIAVLWDTERNKWWINSRFYELPPYLQRTDLARLGSYERALDPRDGLQDGVWFGHGLAELQEDLVRPATPAFVRFTGDAVLAILRREAVGRDALTDMLWVEIKAPDYAGHRWNMIRPEQSDVLRETDRQITRIKNALDRKVGAGNYLLVISADHGQQPLPDLYGGWRINSEELERDLEARFGSVVQKITPVDAYIDIERLESSGYTVNDLARFAGSYTLGDNIAPGAPGADRVPEGRLNERLFAGAFSTDYIQSLTAGTIASFGASDYPEGMLRAHPSPSP